MEQPPHFHFQRTTLKEEKNIIENGEYTSEIAQNIIIVTQLNLCRVYSHTSNDCIFEQEDMCCEASI